MTRKLRTVTGDTPQLTLNITDRNTGRPVDLSAGGTTVLLKVRASGAAVLKGTVSCSKLTGLETSPGVVDVTAPYNVAGAGGRCLAACPSTLFDPPGEYEAEVEVTTGALVATIYDTVRISARQQF